MDSARAALRFVALAPLAVLTLVAPWLPDGPASALLAFGCAALTIALAGRFAPRDVLRPPKTAARVALAGVLCSLAAIPVLRVAPWLGGLLGAAGIALAACALGTQVGQRVESPGHVLPVALLSAGVDLWSVTAASGPTHVIVQTPVLLKLLTVMAPVPPSRLPEPQIGFGDVVFTALYMAVAARFSLPLRRTTAALFAGLVLSGVASALLEAPVPALPALGLLMVIVHPETRRVPAKDRNATLFAAALLCASVARVAVRVAR